MATSQAHLAETRATTFDDSIHKHHPNLYIGLIHQHNSFRYNNCNRLTSQIIVSLEANSRKSRFASWQGKSSITLGLPKSHSFIRTQSTDLTVVERRNGNSYNSFLMSCQQVSELLNFRAPDHTVTFLCCASVCAY